MGTRKVQAIENQCDGCGRIEIAANDEPPHWIWVDWVQVDGTGGFGGKLIVCTERCAIKALKRRHEIEEEARLR